MAAHAAPRRYIIEIQDGAQYRRNRRHLRKGNEQSHCNTAGAGVENLMPSKETDQDQRRKINHPRTDNPETLRRSRYGRLINQNPNYKT